MAKLYNLARMTTATTGTGTITLGAAVSGFLTFALAGVLNGDVISYSIRDGSASEQGTGTYTTSGTTLSRTVLKSTNSDAAISLSGSAQVFITPANTDIKPVYSNITPTTADTTGAVNTVYFADISGLDADRNLTLPVANIGDTLEVHVTTGDATYELILKGAATVTINGGSAATEWSRVFITGEVVKFVAQSATNWVVTYDGRIPCKGQMTLSAAETTNTAAADTIPTWDNKVIDIGEVGDTTNYYFLLRRAGYYESAACYSANTTVTAGKYVQAKIFLNTNAINRAYIYAATVNPDVIQVSPKLVLCAVGDYIQFKYNAEETDKGMSNDATRSWFQVEEVLR